MHSLLQYPLKYKPPFLVLYLKRVYRYWIDLPSEHGSGREVEEYVCWGHAHTHSIHVKSGRIWCTEDIPRPLSLSLVHPLLERRLGVDSPRMMHIPLWRNQHQFGSGTEFKKEMGWFQNWIFKKGLGSRIDSYIIWWYCFMNGWLDKGSYFLNLQRLPESADTSSKEVYLFRALNSRLCGAVFITAST